MEKLRKLLLLTPFLSTSHVFGLVARQETDQKVLTMIKAVQLGEIDIDSAKLAIFDLIEKGNKKAKVFSSEREREQFTKTALARDAGFSGK